MTHERFISNYAPGTSQFVIPRQYPEEGNYLNAVSVRWPRGWRNLPENNESPIVGVTLESRAGL